MLSINTFSSTCIPRTEAGGDALRLIGSLEPPPQFLAQQGRRFERHEIPHQRELRLQRIEGTFVEAEKCPDFDLGVLT